MIAATSGGRPGPGWYFDPRVKEWKLITREEHAAARSLIDLGYVQTSSKYRSVALFENGDYRKQLDDQTLTPAVFTSFREQRSIDQDLQDFREREARRNRAKRILLVLAHLQFEDREDFILDVLCGGSGSCVEYVTGRRIGLTPQEIDEATRCPA